MQNQQLPSTIGNGINVFLSVSVTAVVVGKLLYTTTTNGLRLQLCFALGVGFGLWVGCASRHKQHRQGKMKPTLKKAGLSWQTPLPYLKQPNSCD
jgi:hypothetical protein